MIEISRKAILMVLAGICTFFLVSAGHAKPEKTLMMATTTSTDNTGLLDYLAPEFRKAVGIELRWTATGTGKALKLGENCDVDVLMVHAPQAEKVFVDNGYGTDRREIMYNDFVIIGPEADPAGIREKTVGDALGVIQEKKAVFISRGDNSGTHKKERQLWKDAGLSVPDREEWYIQVGQGMLTAIHIAAARKGYCLTDRGTYIKYVDTLKGDPELRVLVEGDKALLNQYSVIAVNPAHCPNVAYDSAMEFIHWITGPDAQQLIKKFKLLGRPLFTPNVKECPSRN